MFRLGKKPFRLDMDGEQRFNLRAQGRLAGTGLVQKRRPRFRISPAQSFAEQILFPPAAIRHFHSQLRKEAGDRACLFRFHQLKSPPSFCYAERRRNRRPKPPNPNSASEDGSGTGTIMTLSIAAHGSPVPVE